MSVVTRFPPSPTGLFHIGSARTALFNYLFAAHNGGTMYLRFEDTDKERSKKEYEDDIVEGLSWLGIKYETSNVLRQSERTEVYKKYIPQLIDKGLAYEAEGSKDDPHKKVIRFKNPNATITFQDLVRGEVSFNTTDLGDFPIARNIDSALYHLAVVIDDHEQGVTHAIRGEDHISNTPRQILILEALGFQRPLYAHIPLILAKDRSKLSKRHGAVSVNEYRSGGYLPEAIVNYLALLGWNPGGEKELFNEQELIEKFSLEHVQKSGAIFDIEKLKWINREYLNAQEPSTFKTALFERLRPEIERRGLVWDEKIADQLVPVLKERIHTWGDIAAMVSEGELDFFFFDPRPTSKELLAKDEAEDTAKMHLTFVRDALRALDEFTPETIKAAVWDYATKSGRAAVLWPFRYALSGRGKSPDPFTIASVIGKETTLRRVESSIRTLEMS